MTYYFVPLVSHSKDHLLLTDLYKVLRRELHSTILNLVHHHPFPFPLCGCSPPSLHCSIAQSLVALGQLQRQPWAITGQARPTMYTGQVNAGPKGSPITSRNSAATICKQAETREKRGGDGPKISSAANGNARVFRLAGA